MRTLPLVCLRPLLTLGLLLAGGCSCNIQDADGDGVDACQDCDDEDPSLGLEFTVYADDDDDGFGAAQGKKTCVALDGWVDDSTDCNDRAAEFSPAAEETCNNFDDNCDGVIDEGCDTATR